VSGLVSRDDGWRMPDWLCERIEPLLPPPPSHPLGCHRPRVPNRSAMEAILLVLRTGMQWNALDATGICSSSAEVWRQGLLECDKAVGIDWEWLAADGAMTNAPLGAEKTGPNPTDRAKGAKRSLLCGGAGVPVGLAHYGANRNGDKLLRETLESIPIERPAPTAEQPRACG
jgi:putative transposase